MKNRENSNKNINSTAYKTSVKSWFCNLIIGCVFLWGQSALKRLMLEVQYYTITVLYYKGHQSQGPSIMYTVLVLYSENKCMFLIGNTKDGNPRRSRTALQYNGTAWLEPPPLPSTGKERIGQRVKNKEQNGTSVEVGGNMKEILPSSPSWHVISTAWPHVKQL